MLILTESGTGDFVSATGAIREIRRLYPDAHITLVAQPRPIILAETCPYVDELIFDKWAQYWGDIPNFYASELQVLPQLLQHRFDICYSFGLHPNTHFLMYFSGARVRLLAIDNVPMSEPASTADYIAQLATKLFPSHNYGWHMVDRFFAPLDNTLNAPVSNRNIEIWYTPFDMSFAKAVLTGKTTPIYALNVGSSVMNRHYPTEKYAKLLEMILSNEPNATFVILGGGQVDAQSSAIIKNVVPDIYANNTIDMTNKSNFRRDAAILSLCDMYIGNDTGAVQIAAAVKCPVLMTTCFAADIPSKPNDYVNRFCPYGVPNVVIQPAHALPECKINEPYDPFGCRVPRPHCITQIKPETIFKAFKILKQRIAQKNIEPMYIH